MTVSKPAALAGPSLSRRGVLARLGAMTTAGLAGTFGASPAVRAEKPAGDSGDPHDGEPWAFHGTIVDFFADPGGELQPVEGNFRLVDDGLLIVADGKVVGVDDLSVNPGNLANYRDKGRLTEFGPGHLIVPGFIDTHVHWTQIDGIAALGGQILQWLDKYIWKAEEQFDTRDKARAGARFFLETALANGTTTASVFSTTFPESAAGFFDEARALNLRMLTGKNVNDMDSVPVHLRDESVAVALAQTKELINEYHNTDRLLYSLAPRFAINCSSELLKAVGELFQASADPAAAEAAGLTGRATKRPLWLHTHLSENKEENRIIRDRLVKENLMGAPLPGGFKVQSYAGLYDHCKILGKRAIFGHCIELDETFTHNGAEVTPPDRKLMATRGAAMAFCPDSNFFLGSGMQDLRATFAQQVPVGLGTDCGAGTNYCLLYTMNQAFKSQALRAGGDTSYPKMTAWRAFYLATLGGAKALQLDEWLGNFHKGKEADFVVLDLNATPVISRRIAAVDRLRPGAGRVEKWSDKLFALMTLADNRVVEGTYILGQPKYRRGTGILR